MADPTPRVRLDQSRRIKDLLSDTIILLCKNGLKFDEEFSVEALIGITLDRRDVILVSIRETIPANNTTSSDPSDGRGINSLNADGDAKRKRGWESESNISSSRLYNSGGLKRASFDSYPPPSSAPFPAPDWPALGLTDKTSFTVSANRKFRRNGRQSRQYPSYHSRACANMNDARIEQFSKPNRSRMLSSCYSLEGENFNNHSGVELDANRFEVASTGAHVNWNADNGEFVNRPLDDLHRSMQTADVILVDVAAAGNNSNVDDAENMKDVVVEDGSKSKKTSVLESVESTENDRVSPRSNSACVKKESDLRSQADSDSRTFLAHDDAPENDADNTSQAPAAVNVAELENLSKSRRSGSDTSPNVDDLEMEFFRASSSPCPMEVFDSVPVGGGDGGRGCGTTVSYCESYSSGRGSDGIEAKFRKCSPHSSFSSASRIKIEKFSSVDNNESSVPPDMSVEERSIASTILSIPGCFINMGCVKAVRQSLRRVSKEMLVAVLERMSSVSESSPYFVGSFWSEGVSRTFFKCPPDKLNPLALSFYDLQYADYVAQYCAPVKFPNNLKDPTDWIARWKMFSPFEDQRDYYASVQR